MGGYYVNHTGLSAQLDALLSDSYLGSVRFQSSGLEFAPRDDATSASGTASYNYVFSYQDATATGSFTINNLEIDGVAYGSTTETFNDVSLQGLNQVGYDDDNDMILDVNQEVFEVELASTTLTQGSNSASATLNSSLGSITDGSDVIDGLLGSTNIMVNDTTNVTQRARVEKYEVGRAE